MFKRSSIVLAMSVFLSVFPASAQNKKTAFDPQAAFGYLKDLASDAMLGRKSGEPGGIQAAEYIAAKLKSWGLEPAGPNGGFFQDFTFESYEVQRGASLAIVARNRTRGFVYGEDWIPSRYSGSGLLGAEIVFAGYGISAPDKDFDEYAAVDVKDKLVLFSTDTPVRLRDALREEAKLESRIKAARSRGARGVLLFRSDSQPLGNFFRGDLAKEIYDPGFVILSVERKIVDFIFKWQMGDPRYFFRQIEETGKPQSYGLGVQSLINIQADFNEKRPTQNVLAKISGTDPKLKNEIVVVGAHLDHLGVDMTGDILNGADDNASGTAVVMESARVMKLNRFKPKRTILFALWGAEEEGLFGSKHYSENPVFPLDQTVANINLDMVGHGTGKVEASGAYYAPEIYEFLKARLRREILDNMIFTRGGPGGSDHTHFLYNGVPAFYLDTDGPHFKTNRVGDVIAHIKPDIMRNAGLFVLAALEILAGERGVPILPGRREMFHWRYQTIFNHETPPLEKVIKEHQDSLDPDVDFQLAAVSGADGLTGEALRMDLLRKFLDGKDAIARSKGLVLFGNEGASERRRPWKTTVVPGLRGLAAIRDDLRWAEAFSKQGFAFIALDEPGVLFSGGGLSEEGKKILEALEKTNLLLIADGLDAAQSVALLENVKKPVFLRTAALPGDAVLDLAKKTGSTVGLVLGKEQAAASYAADVLAASRRIGAEYVSIVSERCLWGKAGRERMLGVIAGLLGEKLEPAEMAKLFSASFLRVLRPSSR